MKLDLSYMCGRIDQYILQHGLNGSAKFQLHIEAIGLLFISEAEPQDYSAIAFKALDETTAENIRLATDIANETIRNLTRIGVDKNNAGDCFEQRMRSDFNHFSFRPTRKRSPRLKQGKSLTSAST